MYNVIQMMPSASFILLRNASLPQLALLARVVLLAYLLRKNSVHSCVALLNDGNQA